MNNIFGHWDKAKEGYFQIMNLDVVIKSVMDHEKNWGIYPGPHKDIAHFTIGSISRNWYLGQVIWADKWLKYIQNIEK